MPSLSSTANSCGSTWRIFWSAGIATAQAASITRSISDSLTSLLRTATMPCEFSERTCAPEIPQCTAWIRQPAISSASSTARRIESVVDSMLTTMPFFMPLDGALPKPMISSWPSLVSATIQATLEVPISRPTMRFFSGRLLIPCSPARALMRSWFACHLRQTRRCIADPRSRHRQARRQPPNGSRQTARNAACARPSALARA